MRKIVFHAGANKTGSSAIQRFLSLNHLALREEGIFVPNKDFRLARGIGGHHVFSFQELIGEEEAGRERFRRTIDALDIQLPNGEILLSGENLTAHPAGPSLVGALQGGYDVEVILYIRRQDEFLLSSWQQWHLKEWDDFWAWVLSVVGTLGDWRAHLEKWEEYVPRHKITVRVYEREKLEGGDVIADFCDALGLSTPLSDFAYPSGSVNPSFSDAITDLVKGNDLVFQSRHDNDFYNLLVEMTGEKYKKDARESPISFLQRQALLDRYNEQNTWVKENYFPHLEGELFSPPKESDYDYSSPADNEQQKLEFLTTMLYQMYKRGMS